MKIETAYLIGIHPYAFKSGDIGEVISIKIGTPDGLPPRLVYEVIYQDGTIDFVAASDVEKGNYQFIPELEVKASRYLRSKVVQTCNKGVSPNLCDSIAISEGRRCSCTLKHLANNLSSNK